MKFSCFSYNIGDGAEKYEKDTYIKARSLLGLKDGLSTCCTSNTTALTITLSHQ